MFAFQVLGLQTTVTSTLTLKDWVLFYLIIIQQDVTYSVYYISVGSSTCFGC